MAKRKKKSKSKKGPGRISKMWTDFVEQRGPQIVRIFTLLVIISAATISLCVVGAEMRKRNVRRHSSALAVKWGVVLQDTPAWMPPRLADLIAGTITPKNSVFSRDSLCRDIAYLASRSPWVSSIIKIEKVKINKTTGAVKIHAKYREPFARVRNGRGFGVFVDRNGIILPERQVPQWEAIIDGYVYYYLDPDLLPVGVTPSLRRFILIDGVAAKPGKPGQKWQGEDLQAGLKLVKLVSTRNYSRQISVVDVRNFNQRVSESEPELRMFAQIGQSRRTDISFGRFPNPQGGDWVKTPAEKMHFLDTYVKKHGGRLAGIHSSIDVRMGEVRSRLN